MYLKNTAVGEIRLKLTVYQFGEKLQENNQEVTLLGNGKIDGLLPGGHTY
jgi:hypothetical protein